MKYVIFNKKGEVKEGKTLEIVNPVWALFYTTCDSEYRKAIDTFKKRYPEIKIFGATSFNGVFTPDGFIEGGVFLISEQDDQVSSFPVIFETSASSAKDKAKEASQIIKQRFSSRPDIVLMHATPGFEERIIEGIKEIFGDDVPVYGGSAADNDLTGKWKIFLDEKEINEGFLLIAILSKNKIYGAFLGGYLPTKYKGVITESEGRIIHKIDDKPAALVYNEWTHGIIEKYLEKGGNVLVESTLYPIGRIIGKVVGTPVYLLSHPHQVIPDTKSMSFFTEFKKGEQIILMHGTPQALISRTSQVAQRAIGIDKGKLILKGGILIYCAGCVGAIMHRKNEIIGAFKEIVGDIPFIGAATFGEQGSFRVEKDKNRHGNLMCDTILFG